MNINFTKQDIFNISLILLIIFILYKNVLTFGYVWDDLILFVQDSNLREGNWSWDKVSKPVLEGTYYFRPLVMSSFFLEFSITGANSKTSHLINYLIFSLNAILIYIFSNLLLLKIIKNVKFFSLLSTIIYIIHPIQIETVAWVAGRFDLLATTFSLITLIFFIYIKNINLRIFLCSIFWFLGMLCKEWVILIPLLIIIINYTIHQESLLHFLKNNKLTILFASVVLILYLILRVNALGATYIEESEQFLNFSILDRIQFSLLTFSKYLELIYTPFFDIGGIYYFDFKNIYNLKNILSISYALLFILVILVSSVYKKREALLVLCGIISLIFVLQIFNLMFSAGSIASDRFLTFPLIFFILPLMVFIAKKKQKIYFIVLLTWSLGAISTVYSTLPFWKDNYSLWYWQYQKNPKSSTAEYSYLGELYAKNEIHTIGLILEDKKEKEAHLNSYMQLYYANYLLYNNNINSIKYLDGIIITSEFSKDLPYLQRVTLANAYLSRGIAYLKINKDFIKADQDFNKGLDLEPNNINLLISKSLTSHYLKKEVDRINYYTRAINLTHKEYRFSLESNYYLKMQEICKLSSHRNYQFCKK